MKLQEWECFMRPDKRRPFAVWLPDSAHEGCGWVQAERKVTGRGPTCPGVWSDHTLAQSEFQEVFERWTALGTTERTQMSKLSWKDKLAQKCMQLRQDLSVQNLCFSLSLKVGSKYSGLSHVFDIWKPLKKKGNEQSKKICLSKRH